MTIMFNICQKNWFTVPPSISRVFYPIVHIFSLFLVLYYSVPFLLPLPSRLLSIPSLFSSSFLSCTLLYFTLLSFPLFFSSPIPPSNHPFTPPSLHPSRVRRFTSCSRLIKSTPLCLLTWVLPSPMTRFSPVSIPFPAIRLLSLSDPVSVAS